ncbi:Peptidase family M23 [Propionispira arboris]|uniref:Peptidase family M23 n=1 Tax=Propionispira arboris TaxID=84035 RepID=A0A1H7CCF5_9FIRM|nr:M23 family metallopeptidase [Propionispira arboris]SEJ87338.1 Peptidase family M23 [Propionispira arboris]
MREIKHYWLVLTAIVVLSSFSATVLAESLQDKLDTLQKQATDQKNKADSAGAEVNTISGQMRSLQADVDAAAAEYKEVKKKLNDTEAKMDQNKILLEKTEVDLKKKTTILDKRIRDIYINGQISYLDVLFGAKDFSDFMTRMDLLKRIMKYDYDLITKVQEEKALILDKKAELEKDHIVMEELEKAAKEKEQLVKESKAKKQKLLDKVMYDRDTAERAYQETIAASSEVEKLIRQSKYRGTGASHTSGGRMIWPLSGPITSEFGWRTHPIFGRQIFHSGLDIAGDYGDPILAADGGVVINAGWISGYGNTVIIDHGNGLNTLYGHCQSLNVSEGQTVSQGQVIAYVGSTGNSTGPHCHFEVDVNGKAVSPYDYL